MTRKLIFYLTIVFAQLAHGSTEPLANDLNGGRWELVSFSDIGIVAEPNIPFYGLSVVFDVSEKSVSVEAPCLSAQFSYNIDDKSIEFSARENAEINKICARLIPNTYNEYAATLVEQLIGVINFEISNNTLLLYERGGKRYSFVRASTNTEQNDKLFQYLFTDRANSRSDPTIFRYKIEEPNSSKKIRNIFEENKIDNGFGLIAVSIGTFPYVQKQPSYTPVYHENTLKKIVLTLSVPGEECWISPVSSSPVLYFRVSEDLLDGVSIGIKTVQQPNC